MIKLIKTEWLKMRKYTAFWWIMGLTALAYPGINYAFYMVYDDLMNKPTQASKMAKMATHSPFRKYGTPLLIFLPGLYLFRLLWSSCSSVMNIHSKLTGKIS